MIRRRKSHTFPNKYVYVQLRESSEERFIYSYAPLLQGVLMISEAVAVSVTITRANLFSFFLLHKR